MELNSRYFDALLLLLQHPGTLLSRERFLQEVWQGIPVTDEVLTQCIKTLRRQLGDSATQPHLIETIPKHGYRFIAAVNCVADSDAAPEDREPCPGIKGGSDFRRLRLAPVLADPRGRHHRRRRGRSARRSGVRLRRCGAGAAEWHRGLSALLVLVALATLLALIGAAGVVGGIAAARLVARDFTFAGLVGGAVGGLLVGAFGKLIGHDAFLLLFGQAPGDITGALEGLLLGAAVGLADDLGRRFAADGSIQRNVLLAAAIGALAGLLIAMTGGQLLGGSLALLAKSFPDARLHLDPLGASRAVRRQRDERAGRGVVQSVSGRRADAGAALSETQSRTG